MLFLSGTLIAVAFHCGNFLNSQNFWTFGGKAPMDDEPAVF